MRHGWETRKVECKQPRRVKALNSTTRSMAVIALATWSRTLRYSKKIRVDYAQSCWVLLDGDVVVVMMAGWFKLPF